LGRIVSSNESLTPPAATGGSAAADAGQVASGVEPGSCGDGVVQISKGEQCDGSDLSGYTCMGLGLGTGVLGCDVLTCHIVTAQCMQDASSMPPQLGTGGGSGASGVGGSAGGTAGAGGSAGTASCPAGFTCRAPLGQSAQPVCIPFDEATGPVCFTPGPGVDCSPSLPGSTCTATSFGMYCMLPCSP
jgi:hypothetical protein